MDQQALEAYRQQLNRQLAELVANGAETRGQLGTTTQPLPDPSDRAQAESGSGFDLRMRDRDRKLINKIQEALERIEGGTFGICEDCGLPIEEKRLRARPVTSQCIDCKEDSELRENRMRETAAEGGAPRGASPAGTKGPKGALGEEPKRREGARKRG